MNTDELTELLRQAGGLYEGDEHPPLIRPEECGDEPVYDTSRWDEWDRQWDELSRGPIVRFLRRLIHRKDQP